MKKYGLAMIAASLLLTNTALQAFTLYSNHFKHGDTLSYKHAACQYSAAYNKVVVGKNINPELHWSKPPANTQSYVLIMSDPDVPSGIKNPDNTSKNISHSTPRRTILHWVVINIPNHITSIAAGSASKNKNTSRMSVKQIRQSYAGISVYTQPSQFSKSYTGPCARINDERLHHYIWTLYALDTPNTPSHLNDQQLMAFVHRHALGKATLTTTMTNNPKLFSTPGKN